MLHSAEAGDVLSQTNLATIHENHRRMASSDLSQDNEAAAFHQQEALKWWRRAANQGSGKAQASLALYFASQGQDPVQALMWYLVSERRLHGDEVDRAQKERLQLARLMNPSDVREAERRAVLWQPHPEPATSFSG
jgi:TPR repeat protein